MFGSDLKFKKNTVRNVISIELDRLANDEEFNVNQFTNEMIEQLKQPAPGAGAGTKEEEPADPERWILVYRCNEYYLPLRYSLQIFAILMSNRALISERLDYSIIFAENEDHVSGIRTLLNIYTPARPIKIAIGSDEMEALLKEI